MMKNTATEYCVVQNNSRKQTNESDAIPTFQTPCEPTSVQEMLKNHHQPEEHEES